MYCELMQRVLNIDSMLCSVTLMYMSTLYIEVGISEPLPTIFSDGAVYQNMVRSPFGWPSVSILADPKPAHNLAQPD